MAKSSYNFMDESQILKGKFIFVSYSHHEKEIVERDVALLQKEGVRIWFDDNMEPSDDWREVASDKIEHPNCVGVLFYNSEYAFASSACELERQKTWERMKSEPDFKYWFTNVTNEDTNMYIGRAYQIAKDMALLSKAVGESFNIYFNSNILYIKPEDLISYIVDVAKKTGAVDNEDLIIKNLKETGRIEEQRDLIKIGIFINDKYSVPAPHKEQLERFVYNNQELISINDVVYTTKPLYWELLYVKDDMAVLICNRVIAKVKGGDELTHYLHETLKIAFNEVEFNAIVNPPRLLNFKDIELLNSEGKGIPTVTEMPFGDIHYWIDEKGLLENWKMTCRNDIVYKKGFIISVEKGLRPVIEIPRSKIKDFKGDK